MRARYGKENNKRLADESGVNRNTIIEWRDDATEPRPDKVAAIADALGENVIDAYIAAGIFTADEFAQFMISGVERGVSSRSLAAELLRRVELLDTTGSPTAHTRPLAAHEDAPRHVAAEEVEEGRARPRRGDDSSPSPSGDTVAGS